ncbi:type III secretion protein [Mesorhizobium hawassense]|uniref:type III secretion protein n=1 Tax=Mesorhizobium hawassense TaxID=1209954 RepID=UPI001FE0AC9E|nr:type III secretion protein [Mesorhizobium hawassense]
MDDDPSHGHNGIGSSVTMKGWDYDAKAARAVVMGAAVCDQTALLSAIVHAPHMAEGEISSITSSYTVPLREITDEGAANEVRAGHTWNELRRGDRDQTSTVVMDAWANGPAVRLKDSAWGPAPAREVTLSMDKSHAGFLKNRVEGLVPILRSDNGIHTEVRTKLRAPTSFGKYAEPQVISPEFAKSVRNALKLCPEDKKKDIASRMIRDTYGMEPHSPNHQSAVISVLEAVGRLDSLPRPPVVPSEYITAIGSNRPGAEQQGAGNARTDLASSSRSRERSSQGR